ncbi:metallophosphoesterase [Paenibacillus cremeus]|uniref:Metallophosphoesterase n=2 Tax=Paenibacillus cremeus TaxID=2163881 RepID=A0A559K0L0_9BACL|nr:metallophosphoesterase [Paenibacillus cremeus]
MGRGLLGTGVLGTAFYVIEERFWYQVRTVRLSIRNLPDAFKGWKIVQFSDVHFGFYYGTDQFQSVVDLINGLKPDLLFFTGDLLDREWNGKQSAAPLLEKLQAPRGGKWAVLGNHDYTSKKQVIQQLLDSQFQVLINSHGSIDQDGQQLYIAGVDDYLMGKFDLKKTLQGLSNQHCVLLLAHEPDIAELSSKSGVNAQFSGHSHGGQIRMPFFKPFFTPDLAQKYIEGLYEVGPNRMPLYVNRGVGTSNLPIRLFCRPEITVFYLS